MARSRYTDTPVIAGRTFGTYRIPGPPRGYSQLDLLDGVRTVEHIIGVGERADHLAARYLGDDSYWWVICLCNGINYPFSSGGWTVGRRILIPVDVNDVLDRLMR